MLSIQTLAPTKASRDYFIALVWDLLVLYYASSYSQTHASHRLAISGKCPALVARRLELGLSDPDSVLQPGEPPGVWRAVVTRLFASRLWLRFACAACWVNWSARSLSSRNEIEVVAAVLCVGLFAIVMGP